MGKPKHSNDPRGEQKGAQEHAEGQHGAKAHQAFLDGISDHSRRNQPDPNDAALARGDSAEEHERRMANPTANRDGRHRLFENRVQHDEADRAAEHNRRAIDVERHHHDSEQFQITGGRETHPALPQDKPEGTIKSTGDAGGNRSKKDHGHH
jgi:hypothetical protein